MGKRQIDVSGIEYTILIEKGDKHGYVAEVQNDPSIFTDGQTIDEALSNIEKLIVIFQELRGEQAAT